MHATSDQATVQHSGRTSMHPCVVSPCVVKPCKSSMRSSRMHSSDGAACARFPQHVSAPKLNVVPCHPKSVRPQALSSSFWEPCSGQVHHGLRPFKSISGVPCSTLWRGRPHHSKPPGFSPTLVSMLSLRPRDTAARLSSAHAFVLTTTTQRYQHEFCTRLCPHNCYPNILTGRSSAQGRCIECRF